MHTEAEFSAVADVDERGRILRVFGDVDVSSAGRFEALLGAACEAEATRAGSVTVDLSRCRYLDSSGLSVLVRAYRRYAVRLSLVVRPATLVARVVALTGMDTLFAVAVA